ncbi:MAG: NADP oxidoreductase [Anaerolineae bacterium]|nr:NADP oxidoreductase [Anaerolineae bacterium]
MSEQHRVTLATVWLDGCSGCHMSVLDMDERLIELAQFVDVVYSPLVDRKDYPDSVDVALVEGAISSTEDLEKIKKIRQHTKILVALGDCAVASNVPSMRNPFKVRDILKRGYIENTDHNAQVPPGDGVIPDLLPVVRPIHNVVPVDVFVQGCPPSADTIYYVLSELVAGRQPELVHRTRPGA